MGYMAVGAIAAVARDAQTGALDPVAFHVASVVLHVACTFLVFIIVRRLVKNEMAAMVGAALFAVTAANKVLLLGMSGPVAVAMGVLTGIGGGLIRDVLAGRPTLLMSREIYATPILLGCIAFVLLQTVAPSVPYAAGVGFVIIFGLRALAIYRHLEMPAWVTHRDRSPD